MAADAGALLTPLADDIVHLEPLGEQHRDGLRAACSDDEDFWDVYPRNFGAGAFDASFDQMQADRTRMPFALFAGGVLIGMSGYLGIDGANGVVEIGGTYLTRSARGTGLNRRFKDLLIDHAFACGIRRIQLKVDARNIRSQAAVRKLGAREEGILRAERITWTGYVRDTVIFGLLREDWAAVRDRTPPAS